MEELRHNKAESDYGRIIRLIKNKQLRIPSMLDEIKKYKWESKEEEIKTIDAEFEIIEPKRIELFQVYKKRCGQCLFSSARIVDEKRKEEIVEDCKAKNTHFICHKSTLENNGQICCRAFFDLHKNDITKLQIFERLSLINFV